nr:IclR family transcriptional regulator [Gordonia humi]
MSISADVDEEIIVLKTVHRTSQVLSLFTPDAPEWGVSEVARRLSVPKSNTHDVMSSLTEVGFLQRTSAGRYRLGWRLLSMSRSLLDSSEFEVRAAQILRKLATGTGLPVTVGVWDGRRVVSVAGAGPSPGTVLPAFSSALGKALLAHQPWDDVRAALASTTGSAPVSAADLSRQLAEVRRTAVSLDDEETVAGHSCVGTVIRNAGGEVTAALSVCMPAERMRARRQDYSSLLRGAADALSVTLRRSAVPAAVRPTG